MKKAVLITPKTDKIPFIDGADYIGVDAGSLHILHAHLPIRFAVGDFDSMSDEELDRIQSVTVVYKHPVEKDETDSELALRLCQEMGYDSIVLWGGLSGRLDHTLSNIQLILYRNPNVVLMDEFQRVQLFKAGTYTLEHVYAHISFFAMEPSIMTTKGLYYPVEHAKVECRDMYMVSNSFVQKTAELIVHSGSVLCIETNYQ